MENARDASVQSSSMMREAQQSSVQLAWLRQSRNVSSHRTEFNLARRCAVAWWRCSPALWTASTRKNRYIGVQFEASIVLELELVLELDFEGRSCWMALQSTEIRRHRNFLGCVQIVFLPNRGRGRVRVRGRLRSTGKTSVVTSMICVTTIQWSEHLITRNWMFIKSSGVCSLPGCGSRRNVSSHRTEFNLARRCSVAWWRC